MKELALSSDIKQIELEINHHKNIAGQSIWEIGRRLNHVKENDLAHGEFISWVESIGIDRSYANRYMKVAKELNVDTSLQLGVNALYLIATLPEEERLKEHVTYKGEIKTPDEMTTRELQQLKKQLKEQEELINQLGDNMEGMAVDYRSLESENERLKNKKPTVVTETVKVVPDDYEILKERNEYWRKKAESLESSLKIAQSKYQLLESSTAEAKELKQQIDSLAGKKQELTQAINATSELHDLENKFNEFFDKEMAPMKFKGIAKYLSATNAVDRVHDLVNLADAWVEEMRRLVPMSGIKIIEGEIIND